MAFDVLQINSNPRPVTAPFDANGDGTNDHVTLEARDDDSDGSVDWQSTEFTGTDGVRYKLVEEAANINSKFEWGEGSRYSVIDETGELVGAYVMTADGGLWAEGDSPNVQMRQTLQTYYTKFGPQSDLKQINVQGERTLLDSGVDGVKLEPGARVTVIWDDDREGSPTEGMPRPRYYDVGQDGVLVPVNGSPKLTEAEEEILRDAVAPDKKPDSAGFQNQLWIGGDMRIDFPIVHTEDYEAWSTQGQGSSIHLGYMGGDADDRNILPGNPHATISTGGEGNGVTTLYGYEGEQGAVRSDYSAWLK